MYDILQKIEKWDNKILYSRTCIYNGYQRMSESIHVQQHSTHPHYRLGYSPLKAESWVRFPVWENFFSALFITEVPMTFIVNIISQLFYCCSRCVAVCYRCVQLNDILLSSSPPASHFDSLLSSSPPASHFSPFPTLFHSPRAQYS